jgi:transposase
MPPQRTPLASITAQRAFNYQLSPYQRGRVIGMTEEGAKSSKIAATLNISRGAIRSTLSLDHLRDEGNPQPRCGPPLRYTPADERNLLRHVRLHPKDTYTQVIEACNLRIKKDTVKKILKRHGIENWNTRRRLFLTEANAAKRLA